MDRRIKYIVICSVVAAGCQLDGEDRGGDGKKNDLVYWWASTDDVQLECLSVPGKNVRMTKSGQHIETGADNRSVYYNYVNDYLVKLDWAGCKKPTSVKSFWSVPKLFVDGKWIRRDPGPAREIKHLVVYSESRFRFKIGSTIGYIFSPAEHNCFSDTSQHPDLVQRAIDCNVNRDNDVSGLVYKQEPRIYECLGNGTGTAVNPQTGAYINSGVVANNIYTPLCDDFSRAPIGSGINEGCSFASIASNDCGYSTPERPIFTF